MLTRYTGGKFVIERISRNAYYQFQGTHEGLIGPTLNETEYWKLEQRQESTPLVILTNPDVMLWVYKGKFYCDDVGYSVDEVKLKILELENEEKEQIEKMDIWELERSSESLDESLDLFILNSLSAEKLQGIVSIRTRKLENLYNDAKKEYEDWIVQGKSAAQKAVKELLEPGQEIKQLEQYIGKIPVDFLGSGIFESSPIYKRWSTRIEEVKLPHHRWGLL